MDPPDSFLHLESLSRFSFLQFATFQSMMRSLDLRSPEKRTLQDICQKCCIEIVKIMLLVVILKLQQWRYLTKHPKLNISVWYEYSGSILLRSLMSSPVGPLGGSDYLTMYYNRRQHGITPCCTRLHTVAWYCTVKNSCCFILWSDSGSAYGSWTSTGHRVLIYNVYRQKKDDDNHFNDDNEHYKIDQNNI